MINLRFCFLLMFLALPMAMKADSAKEKKDDTRYLVGAVPEVEGKVVFSKEFQIPGMSQAQIYDTMTKWMDERLKEIKTPTAACFLRRSKRNNCRYWRRMDCFPFQCPVIRPYIS